MKKILNKILFQRSPEADHMSVISSWQLTTLAQSPLKTNNAEVVNKEMLSRFRSATNSAKRSKPHNI